MKNCRKIKNEEMGTVISIEINKRNQILSYNGIPLRYDRNGNLLQFKDRYIYDWKNQLVRVEKENGEVVEFKYDVLGRRIEKKLIASNHTETTRYYYDGWRVIEERDQIERVKTRYTYGNWIDEVIEIEKDRDNDGIFETYYPLQNTIGSVIGLVGKDGEIVERISYSPYGKPTFIYDKIPPEVDSVRVEEGKIVVRFSEAVRRETAERAIKIRKGTNIVSGTLSFEDEDKLVRFTPSAPLQNEELMISITTELEDLSGNNLKNEFSQSFTYTGTDSVIYDRVPPEIQSIRLISNSFYIELSEEIEQSSVQDSIELKTSSGTISGEMNLDNSKTIKFTPSISLSRNSQYTITVKGTVKDLSGKPLSESLTKEFTYQGSDLLIFQKPDPNQRKESSVGNTTLFQGREYDPETGLYYFRARYYHPELGRFLQTDPKGYVDSLNLYQAFGNNPVNFKDPYGFQYTYVVTRVGTREETREKIMSLQEYYQFLKEMKIGPRRRAEMLSSSIYAKSVFTKTFLFERRKEKDMTFNWLVMESLRFNEDLYTTVRAIWGETQASVRDVKGGYPEELYSAIAWTIKNRAVLSGKSMAEIASAPNQYQGYDKNWDVEGAVRHIDAILRMEKLALDVILGIGEDITKGSVSFYSRKEKSTWVPEWAKSESGEIAPKKEIPTLYYTKKKKYEVIWRFYKDISPWIRKKK
jgi:RHS repeat-associated protein